MIQTGTTTRVTSNDFLKRAITIASHYGFAPIDEILTRKDDYENTDQKEKDVKPATVVPNISPLIWTNAASTIKKDYLSDNIVSILKRCASSRLTFPARPILIYYNSDKSSALQSKLKDHKAQERNAVQFMLAVLGTEQCVAEALTLKTALSILDDIGLRKNCVHVNSIGDRDSSQKFTRELNTYFKKNLQELSAYGVQTLKRDVFEAHEYVRRKKHPLFANVPIPMEFLSDYSRRHLREILEYLETDGISYEVDNHLIGHSKYYSETLFEIHDKADDADVEDDIEMTLLAKGGRFDEIARQLFKSHIPAVAIMLELTEVSTKKRAVPNPVVRIKRPKIYLIQVGFAAKLRGLSVIEMLRKAHIPLHYSLGSDKLVEQLTVAEKLEIPYTVIMGQREALDGTVIVRNMDTQSQDTVSISILPEYMKKINI